jgi:hypothetical protein
MAISHTLFKKEFWFIVTLYICLSTGKLSYFGILMEHYSKQTAMQQHRLK